MCWAIIEMIAVYPFAEHPPFILSPPLFCFLQKNNANSSATALLKAQILVPGCYYMCVPCCWMEWIQIYSSVIGSEKCFLKVHAHTKFWDLFKSVYLTSAVFLPPPLWGKMCSKVCVYLFEKRDEKMRWNRRALLVSLANQVILMNLEYYLPCCKYALCLLTRPKVWHYATQLNKSLGGKEGRLLPPEL